MAIETLKRGDTFVIDAVYGDGTTPLPPSIMAQARDELGSLLDDLTIDVTNAAAGKFRVSATANQTAYWPVGNVCYDVEYTDADGTVHSTQTEVVAVLHDITHS